MKLDYNSREIFFGNEALIVADMAKGSNGKPEFTNHKIVTGLVSVGAMEDQAETNSYPADDVPDHGVKKGATLLQGEMVFIQTDQSLKEDILGQQRTENGLGWSPTGNWKTKCVQYLIKGRKRDKVTGEFVDGYRVVVYPNLRPTAEATKESETDSVDGVDPIQWTLAVQATESDIYLNGGKKVPAIEYEIWGEQAKDFVKKMESGLFIMQPDTVLAGGITLVAPVIPNVTTATKGHNDGRIVVPATLKDSNGGTVKVTSVINDANGKVATNGQLAPGAYNVKFSAEGYKDVTAGVSVTDHS
ncbi:capsid protein [Porphyromonas macacae]|uniref:Capsid protein n=12 Tax=Bacteria TaxID=2 RepID=A0A154VWR2_9PROT|nr:MULTISPECIES: phage tail tube protein [Bacteria]KGA88473.1 capsid protein [Escherichia coli]KGN98377.1 capsid protein [Porphyromonas macacae]KHJ73488.1 capsid protein [Rhodococcus sp. Chr-9]KKA46543.1 cell wall surface anchor family protein [Enterococcus faecalis EnGen0310 = MMH594]KZD05648.1 capsid protein [Oceanibaculum pacificum]